MHGTNDPIVVDAAVAVLAALARTPVVIAIYIVVLHGFAQDQLASPFRVEALDAKDIVRHDCDTMSVRSTLARTNSHNDILGHPPRRDTRHLL